MRKAVLIIIVIAAVALGYYFYSQKLKTVTPVNTTTSTPTPNDSVTIPVPEEKIEELKMGGSSYAEKNGVYSFLYPNDYTFDEQNNGEVIRVYKQGPTQKGQTEMYDGVIVSFQLINLEGKTLENYVDEQIANATLDGVSEVTAPKSKITVNGYNGFTYTLRGLGEFPIYVMQKDASSTNAVSISTLVADPGNLGFQDDVNAILNTLTIHK